MLKIKMSCHVDHVCIFCHPFLLTVFVYFSPFICPFWGLLLFCFQSQGCKLFSWRLISYFHQIGSLHVFIFRRHVPPTSGPVDIINVIILISAYSFTKTSLLVIWRFVLYWCIINIYMYVCVYLLWRNRSL